MLCFKLFYQLKNPPQKTKKILSIPTISGGSCDTEDWSNDAENTALSHSNKSL